MANEKRLIDANELNERIKSYAGMFTDELGFVVSLEAVVRGIDFSKTVDAVEVVHGRWLEHRPNVYECTACHTWYGNYGGCEEWAYCPNCGAKMDGGNGQ